MKRGLARFAILLWLCGALAGGWGVGTSLQIILVKQIMIHMSHMIHMQSSLLMFKANFRISISLTRNAGKYTLEGRLSYQICTAFDRVRSILIRIPASIEPPCSDMSFQHRGCYLICTLYTRYAIDRRCKVTWYHIFGWKARGHLTQL